jgi:hypothetical protein
MGIWECTGRLKEIQGEPLEIRERNKEIQRDILLRTSEHFFTNPYFYFSHEIPICIYLLVLSSISILFSYIHISKYASFILL